MRNSVEISGTETLRKKAEGLLKNKQIETNSQLSEAETLKLIHELQVHQLELEIQNEELILAQSDTQDAIELYDFAPSGYFTLSKEGDIMRLNLHGAMMLGKERSSLNNSRFGLFVSNDTKPIFNLFLQNIFDSKHSESCEVSIPNNENLLNYIRLTGIITEGGEKCLVTAHDITELKKAEEEIKLKNNQLVIADASKDRFLSILAHDLKSPFGAIFGFLDILAENVRENNLDEIENLIDIIDNSAHSVYNLLEDILMWENSQSNKLTCEPQKLYFIDICQTVVENLQYNANNKNIIINLPEKDNITVFADVNLLKTVLRNLISNAIKFTNPGGEININAVNNQTNVMISVSDNGMGIAPDILGKLFDMSQILTTTGTAEEKGTGLGLLLCKDFVEKHGGKIWAESKLGKGSNFIFTLPGENGYLHPETFNSCIL